MHVTGGKHEDAQAHTGHDQHEDRRQWIELITPLDVQQRIAGSFGHFAFSMSCRAAIDADCATRNPAKTKSILAGEIRLGPLRMSAESILINRRDADQKRQRDRAHSDSADEPFGKAKLATQQAVNRSANER